MDLNKELVKRDLSAFITSAFNIINPGAIYLHNWHVELIAEGLGQVTNGNLKRLIINMPPRHLKSWCISVAWPAWLLGTDPTRRIIAASYSQMLSNKHSVDCRNLISSDWYKEVFPELEMSKKQNQKIKFATMKHGFRFASSVGGTITGEGGNFLIVDDPHNALQMSSPKMRRRAIEWFEQSFISRLDDRKKGAIVIVMQRLHDEDLTGHLLKKRGSPWHTLTLPMVFEEKTYVHTEHLAEMVTKGCVLHSQRDDEEEVKMLRLEVGEQTFSAQYQQAPIPKVGSMLQLAWLKRYQIKPDNISKIVQSWDTAIKSASQNDYSVCTIWAETRQGYFLLEVIREKMEYPELKRLVLSIAEKWQPHAILIEDKSSGSSIIQDIHRDHKLPIMPMKTKYDKITRFAAVTPLFESGLVFLPESASWLAEYEMEIVSFPHSSHDDQVDSTSQFLDYIRQKPTSRASTKCI